MSSSSNGCCAAALLAAILSAAGRAPAPSRTTVMPDLAPDAFAPVARSQVLHLGMYPAATFSRHRSGIVRAIDRTEPKEFE